ncbi:MAG: hypothetical protein V2A61_06730 [Calditrichota bacterium]
MGLSAAVFGKRLNLEIREDIQSKLRAGVYQNEKQVRLMLAWANN